MELENLVAVILAGGKGTRMNSRLPKMLHPVLGEPMIFHALRTAGQCGIPPQRTVIVIGHGAEQMRQIISTRGDYRFAYQPEQLGTGHALMTAASVAQPLGGPDSAVLVFYGDNALIRPQTLQSMFTHYQRTAQSATPPLITMATSYLTDATGYGRIIRDPSSGRFAGIVEEVDLTPELKAIEEFNPGLYLFQSEWLWRTLPKLKKSAKGEYYLTDLPAFAVETHPQAVQTVTVEAVETLGINDRVQLAEVASLLRNRVLRELMLSGVTITDPATTYISAESRIAPDTVIEPNTHLRGQCQIGSNCVIGPNSILTEATVGDDCRVLASVVEQSTLEGEVWIGPFSRVRPGCYLERGVRMGNFAEVSRSRIGANTKQSHFSFIGDATLGEDVNIGAGTITANYDGINKNKTVIGKRVFLGSDTVLRAPVTLENEARTGAGSVVTKNVEAGVTVVGMPARPIKRKKSGRTATARAGAGRTGTGTGIEKGDRDRE